jgi:ureidoacrylate peracid hydrolase
MNKVTYEKENTALLVIDPYNDFISEGGKLWNRVKAVAEANHCVDHMLQVLTATRKAKLRVFYALHRRYRPDDYETWKYIAPVQKAAWSRKTFEYGTWGGEIRSEFEPQPGDIVAAEHWCSSGFPTPIWTCSLRNTAFISSSSSGLLRIHASRRLFATLPSSATRSRW